MGVVLKLWLLGALLISRFVPTTQNAVDIKLDNCQQQAEYCYKQAYDCVIKKCFDTRPIFIEGCDYPCDRQYKECQSKFIECQNNKDDK